MRGIPKRIGTKQDVFNLCRELPVARAAMLLKDIDKDERNRLGLTLKEVKVLAGEIKERKRSEEAADKKISRLKAEKAGIEKNVLSLLKEIEDLRESLKAAVEAGLTIGKHKAAYEVAQGELNDLNKTTIAPARGEDAVRRDINGARARLMETRGAGEQLAPKEREHDSYVGELTVRRKLEKQLAALRPAEAIEADIAQFQEEIQKLNTASNEHGQLKEALASLEGELIRSVKTRELNDKKLEASKRANEALNAHRRASELASTKEALEAELKDRLGRIDDMKPRLAEIEKQLNVRRV